MRKGHAVGSAAGMERGNDWIEGIERIERRCGLCEGQGGQGSLGEVTEDRPGGSRDRQAARY